MPPVAAIAAGGVVGAFLMADASKHNANAARSAANAQTQAMLDARLTESANRLEATKDQNQTMRLGIMTQSKDFQFQVLAWLTQQLESLDVKTQIAMKDAEVRIAQINSDTRIEEGKLKLDARELDIREEELHRPDGVSSGSLLA